MGEQTNVEREELDEAGHVDRQRSVQQAVDSAVEEMRKRLEAGELKPTVAEFVRLLELQKELVENNVRCITITWVDPWTETEPSLVN